MKRFFVLVLAACAVFSSCGTARRVSTDPSQPWVGCSTMDILQVMGDPDRIDGDGQGGSILVYESTPDYNSPDYDILDPNAEARRTRRYAKFYLDDEGTCYRVDTNRNLPAPPRSVYSGDHSSIWVDILFYLPFFVIGILL